MGPRRDGAWPGLRKAAERVADAMPRAGAGANGVIRRVAEFRTASLFLRERERLFFSTWMNETFLYLARSVRWSDPPTFAHTARLAHERREAA